VEYDGGTPPAGAAPWVVATFDDRGSTGAVALTITSRLADAEFLDRILFNLDPAFDPSALRFRQEYASGPFASAYVLTGADDLQAGGHTLFDIKLMFETDPGPGRFDAADSVSYTITGVPSLTADSFAFGSVGGSKTNLLTAAGLTCPTSFPTRRLPKMQPSGHANVPSWQSPAPHVCRLQ
jgi:hypothetical protein